VRFASLFLTSILFFAAPPPGGAELPVQKVILYKHGVGYFERSGTAPAGEPLRLEFKTEEMNDVLKSLTLFSSAGTIGSVRFESSEPLERKLGEFPFRIGDQQPLSRLLDQLKGAEVSLRLGGDALRGTIVSARTVPASDEQPERHELVLLTPEGEVRTVNPAEAAGLRFAGEKLRRQFRDYLLFTAQSRNREKRALLIQTERDGAEVTARYVTPAPVWKSSYRLVFDGGEEPLLEGWAIVHNTSGEDWSGVALSLVSGQPVSFITNLYEPDYKSRPRVELPEAGPARPVIHGGVVEEEADQVRPEEQARRDRRAMAKSAVGGVIGGVAPMAEMRAQGAREQFRDQDVASNLAQTASAAELGELFEYRIASPVTVESNESALLPFLQQRVAGRKLLIYNSGSGSQHPLNAAELTNDTEKTLDGGAVTVFESGAYAGESLFETIKAGDRRLISYGVDLGTRITTAFDSERKTLSRFTVKRGVLTTRQLVRETRTYTIRNVDDKAKTLIVEQPVRSGYKVVNPQPAEKTADAYRFEVPLEGAETKKFAVTEERPISNSVALTNLTYDQLMVYVRNEELDAAGRRKLERIADLKRQIAGRDNELQRIEQQINELFNDQERIRRNISSLRSVSGRQEQVQEYAEKLARQEEELVAMRDRQAELRKQRDELQKQVNNLIENLEI